MGLEGPNLLRESGGRRVVVRAGPSSVGLEPGGMCTRRVSDLIQ